MIDWVRGGIQDSISPFVRAITSVSLAFATLYQRSRTRLHAPPNHSRFVTTTFYKSINGSSTFCAGAACGAAGKLSGPYPPIAYGVAGFQLLCCCCCCGGC